MYLINYLMNGSMEIIAPYSFHKTRIAFGKIVTVLCYFPLTNKLQSFIIIN